MAGGAWEMTDREGEEGESRNFTFSLLSLFTT